MLKSTAIVASCAILVGAGCATTPAKTPVEPGLQTAPERTDGRATTTHAQTVRLVGAIADRSPIAIEATLGKSSEGRRIPLLVIADPPVTTPGEARASGKLIVYAFGGIHSGEACGKEALLQLARDIALHPDRPGNRMLLDNIVLLVAPMYNPDGDARRSPGNRPGQVGPIDGMGQRANAQGLDLNRDHVKLEAPETRAQVRLLNEWDPHIIIDTHTTDGSYHRFALTYAPPLNPSGDQRLLSYAQDDFLPEVARRLRRERGIETFPYGNFNKEKTTWTTYSANPMFGGSYRGLRNRISILSEAYAYSTFAERIAATEAFVRGCLTLAAERRESIGRLVADADRRTIEAPTDPTDPGVGIRHTLAPASGTAVIPGWLEAAGDSGRSVPTGAPRDYQVEVFDRFIATRTVPRPLAYLIPPGLDAVVANLRLHGVVVESVSDDQVVEVEIDRVVRLERAEREFQGHRMVSVGVERDLGDRRVGPGWWSVSTAQPLGALIVYLLEPESEGGLAAWNVVDRWIEVGEAWPILRQVRSPSTRSGSSASPGCFG